MMPYDRTLARFFLVKQLEHRKHLLRGRLLNAGCGDRTYEHVYGPVAKETIRLDWPQTQHNKDAIDVYGSVAELPFRAEAFDAVLCTEVLEHVRDPEQTLREFWRVLIPGGRLVLSVPFLYQVHEQPCDFYRYTYFGLCHLLTQAGFQLDVCLARGDVTAVAIFFWRKWMARVASRIVGARFAGRVPWTWLDRLYIAFIGNRLVDLPGQGVSYTLGYTVFATKTLTEKCDSRNPSAAV